MSARSFEKWFSTFRDSINGYRYYVDFDKAYENAQKVKIEISILNSLVGSDNIENDFDTLLEKYPECLRAIPILLAKRESEIYCQDENGAVNFQFGRTIQSNAQYKHFMRETGLFDLMKNHVINNLFDYVTGVEAGLSSNGRKNRGGHQMENLVEMFLKKSGVKYHKEMYLTEIEKKWNVDLSPISADGTSTKRWDFVVETSQLISAIETNFYTSGGSKLNETARSYKMIAEEARSIEGFRFVWVTDGKGWMKARRNLQETFNAMDHIYNVADMENGVFLELFK